MSEQNVDAARGRGEQALQGTRFSLGDDDLGRGEQTGNGELEHKARRSVGK